MKQLKVIKIGGNIINNTTVLEKFLEKFASIEGPKILVHGGGKLATKLANKLQVEVQMEGGRRITDAATLEIITMVYAGSVNKNIVANLQKYQCNSLGFSGPDGNVIVSKKRSVSNIDYGFVGDVVAVNTTVLETVLNAGITPVFCAISHDGEGQLLNTNADTIAAELAISFATTYTTELYYCFEKKGVLLDVNDENSVVENLNKEKYHEMLQTGTIADGMLPKLNNSFYASAQKVTKVCIGQSEMLFKKNSKFTSILAS